MGDLDYTTAAEPVGPFAFRPGSARYAAVKALALKTFVCLFAAFAAYYVFFLGSIACELYGPGRWCGTAQVWALQGAAIFFAPPAFLGSIGLWFAGRKPQTLGRFIRIVSKVSLVILLLCVVVNLLIFLPGG